MNPQDWKLILLALIAITALIVLITKAKVNAFLSLLMASLVVGLGAVLLLGVLPKARRPPTPCLES
jgi:H+/gluconate symporter-like permease